MKNSLSDIYEQVLLNEAEKHSLQNPTSDEVGSLKTKQDLFGNKPKPVEGPDKAKLQQGPSYKETTGTSSAPKSSSSSMPKSAPAKATKVEGGKEMKDTEVDPTEENEEKEESETPKKKKVAEESFTMSAFETLFKKTLMEEMEEDMAPAGDVSPDTDVDADSENPEHEEGEEELEEEEGDLISDLRELQDKLASILDKLEDVQSEEENQEDDENSYSDDDFDEEFAEPEEEEEGSFKESMDKPKPLNNSKGKVLMGKKNKIGRLSAKGGKAHGGSLKNEPKPKALGDKKGSLQKGKPEVRSSIKKGDFIK